MYTQKPKNYIKITLKCHLWKNHLSYLNRKKITVIEFHFSYEKEKKNKMKLLLILKNEGKKE